jgi:spore coat polysaccharide biosynthesis protein SpsF (cytidylyltransferase family)
MIVYKVSFVERMEKKTVYIFGDNEAEAGKRFSEAFPAVPSSNVISVLVDSPSNQSQVVISDISMPFMSMVVFMVKAAIAAIPAAIILSLIGMLVSGLFMGGMS